MCLGCVVEGCAVGAGGVRALPPHCAHALTACVHRIAHPHNPTPPLLSRNTIPNPMMRAPDAAPPRPAPPADNGGLFMLLPTPAAAAAAANWSSQAAAGLGRDEDDHALLAKG